MPFLERNGVQIHYETVGDASLPALVLSHSLGVHLGMWQPQLDALSSRFRLLLYDMRGHGESVSSNSYDIADMGQDVLRLMDQLGLETVHFCGLSMGGVIGQWLGIHAADRLRKLILANTAAKIGNDEGWNARIATVTQEGMSPVITGTLERWFTADFRATRPEIVNLIEAMLRATDPQGYAACCAAIRDADFRETISSVKLPTLIITGTHDPATPSADGQFLAVNIQTSQYVELSAAHLSNVEAASEFNVAVLNFLIE